MAPVSRGYAGPREVAYLFVDGDYLDKVVEKYSKEFFGGDDLPIDWAKLSSGFTKTFYYNCLPGRRSGEDEATHELRVTRQQNRFQAMQASRGWHVQEGIVKRTGKRATQKEVDILIAVDMLTHTYRRNMHRLRFIAGDQDFRPLVEALVRDGMYVEVSAETTSVNRDLMNAADAFTEIDLYSAFGWLESSYQDAHPLPERGWVFPDSNPRVNALATTTTENGDSATLFPDNGQYTVITISRKSSIHVHEMKHPDLEYLKKIHAYCFGQGEWKS